MFSVNVQLNENLKKIKTINNSISNININNNDLSIDDKTINLLENIKNNINLIGIKIELLISQAYENKSNSFNNIISLIDYQLTSGSECETDEEYDNIFNNSSTNINSTDMNSTSIDSTSIDSTSIDSTDINSTDINSTSIDSINKELSENNYDSICELMKPDENIVNTIISNNIDNSLVDNMNKNSDNFDNMIKNMKKISPKIFSMFLYTYMLNDPKSILNDPNALQGKNTYTLDMLVNGYNYFEGKYDDVNNINNINDTDDTDKKCNENIKKSSVEDLD